MSVFPFFTRNFAAQKVRLAEDAWNSRDPKRVSLDYAPDCSWRNRTEWVWGRSEILRFLARKWETEQDFRSVREMWAFNDRRLAVRCAYEWHDASGNWFRSCGNETWEFDDEGLVKRRFACINDLPIAETQRKFHWPLGPRPDGYPGLSELGL